MLISQECCYECHDQYQCDCSHSYTTLPPPPFVPSTTWTTFRERRSGVLFFFLGAGNVVALLLCCVAALWRCCFAALLRCCAVALALCCPVALQSFALTRCCFAALTLRCWCCCWHCAIMILLSDKCNNTQSTLKAKHRSTRKQKTATTSHPETNDTNLHTNSSMTYTCSVATTSINNMT